MFFEVLIMIVLDYSAKTPIFEQIKEQIIFLVQKGVFLPNVRLPSIRALAAQLGVNVNTVKHAYQVLEESDIIYSELGKGFFVAQNAADNKKVKGEALEVVRAAVSSALSMGVKKEELFNLIEALSENI